MYKSLNVLCVLESILFLVLVSIFAGYETVHIIGDVMDMIKNRTCIQFMAVDNGLSRLSKTRSAISFDTIGAR